jgi:hypothetical protein
MRFAFLVFFLFYSTISFSNNEPSKDFILSNFDSETTIVIKDNTITTTTVIKNNTFNYLVKILTTSLLLLSVLVTFSLIWAFWYFIIKTIDTLLSYTLKPIKLENN